MQSPRWPFLAALVAVVVGGGVAKAAPNADPAAVDAVMSISDREQMHVAKQAFDREQPAADLLARLTLPSGIAECNQAAGIASSHMLCWEGDAEIVATTATLAAGLRALGAKDVSPWCGKLSFESHSSLVLCRVKADVVGQPFSASLGPGIDREHPGSEFRGLFASGGVGQAADWGFPISSRATPIPVPEMPDATRL